MDDLVKEAKDNREFERILKGQPVVEEEGGHDLNEADIAAFTAMGKVRERKEEEEIKKEKRKEDK
jgi:hypothetical protein